MNPIYDKIFAKNGIKADIPLDEWLKGWAAITEKFNGVPTAEQFNQFGYALTMGLAQMMEKVEQKAGAVQIGPASLINELVAGEILLITDGNSAVAAAVTLDDILTQGYNGATGKPSTLPDLLTVGVSGALNLRCDENGTFHDEGNIAELVAKVQAMCDTAVAGGQYTNPEAGRVDVSWHQVQYYIIYGKLVDNTTASAVSWSWYKQPAIEYEKIISELQNIRADIGTVNVVLDQVVDGKEDA